MILLSALGLSFCAAYYSIIGLTTFFSGAKISIGIMTSFLEIGKICSVTFLYRYWKKCKTFIKIYLMIALIFLMMITSFGIAGILIYSYQKSSIEFGVTQEKITSLQDQKSYFQDKIVSSKKRIDDLTKFRTSQESRMGEVLTNEFIARNPVQLRQLQQQNIDLINDTESGIKGENTKIQDSIDGLGKIDEQINQLKLGNAEKKDVQTFKFVADALKLPLDTVARWFILSIILVFDPLAICLILAYNIAVYKKEDESIYDDISKNISKIEPNQLYSTTHIPPEPILPTPISSNEQPIKKIEEKSINNRNSMTDFFKKMYKIS